MLSTDPDKDNWSSALVSKGFTSIVSAPLQVSGHAIGCISAFNREGKAAFTEKDLGLVSQFAQFVSLALEHADLYGKLRELADTDPLTGLLNHRVLMETIKREIARSQRSKRPFTVLLIDIDKFKAVNDTYGHLAGDAVLRELAERLRKNVRASDIVGRYGGEEFLAVLPETDEDQALVAATRLHEKIAESQFSIPHDETIPVHVSIGIATFPDDATELPYLIATADLALYEAKHRGGSRTIAADWLPKK